MSLTLRFLLAGDCVSFSSDLSTWNEAVPNEAFICPTSPRTSARFTHPEPGPDYHYDTELPLLTVLMSSTLLRMDPPP